MVRREDELFHETQETSVVKKKRNARTDVGGLHYCVVKTDANGNALLQSFLSKLFKRKKTYRRCGENGEKKYVCFFNVICSRGGTRRNLCFQVEHCQHADKNSSRNNGSSIST